MPSGIRGPQIASLPDGLDTINLNAGILSADAAGRAKMAAGWFDNTTTVADKFAAASIGLDRLEEAVIQADGGQAFTADQPMGGFKITGHGAPTAPSDLVRLSDLDAKSSGLDWKISVRLATNAALPANTASGSGVGKTLTATANGALSVDSVVVVAADRILVKDEVASADNGPYTVTQVGDGSNPYILTRATDADEDDEVTANMAMFAEEGTANADTGWTVTTDAAITVDTTSVAFAQFTGAGTVVAGVGLTKTGSTIDVGVTSIGLVLNADSIDVAYALVGELTSIDAGDAAVAGTDNKAARGDHQHAVNTAAPGATQLGATAGEGVALTLSRSDHIHKANTTALGLAVTGTIGTSQDIARADHQHPANQNAESVVTENITNTDTAMTDLLNATPLDVTKVVLELNGVVQIYGAGNDFTIAGTTITWLASTGTAVNMKTTDTLIARYLS